MIEKCHKFSRCFIFFLDLISGDANYVSGRDGWVERTTKFLEPYVNCTKDSSLKPADRECFEPTLLGACYSDKPGFSYGYDEGKPCVFLKLNKIYGLKNTAYDVSHI